MTFIDENLSRNKVDEEDSEEKVVRRKPSRGGAAKRAIVADDESYEESKGHKSDGSEEDLADLDDEDSYESATIKKKVKKPAKKAPPASAPMVNKKNSLSSAAGELRKRPSEITNTVVEDASYIDNEDQVIGGGFTSVDDILDARPYFIKEDKIRDLQGNKLDDPNYDPTSLLIPEKEWATFTPAKVQFWQIKQHNFDKILFFKLGKFYEIFYNDAIICQKILDLNWMGGAKKLHVGFPEKALDKYLVILVNHGFKVAVIEQTETPKQMEER